MSRHEIKDPVLAVSKVSLPAHEVTKSGKIPDDFLFRERFVQVVQSIIASRNAGRAYIVCIYGDWGAGKTWVMRRVQEELKEEIPTLWFDAWKYEAGGSLLVPLVVELESLIPNGKSGDVSRKTGRELRRLLNVTSKGLGPAVALSNPIAGVAIGALVSFFDFDPQREVAKAKDNLPEKFGELVNAITENKDRRPLLICVDDLDRCRPETVIAFLEELKHVIAGASADMVFLLGLDRAAVQKAVSLRYANFDSSDADAYLRKIIRLGIELPPSGRDSLFSFLRDSSSKLGLQLTDNEANVLIEICSSAGLNNPRSLLRALESALVVKDIYSGKNSSYQSLPVIALMMLREFWPSIYHGVASGEPEIIIQGMSTSDKVNTAQRRAFFDDKRTAHPLLLEVVGDSRIWRFFARLKTAKEAGFTEMNVEKIKLLMAFCQLTAPLKG